MLFNPQAIVSKARDAQLALRGLPAVAYAYSPADPSRVVGIRRGETGFYPIETSRTAHELNESTGVSLAQAEAMLAGSLFGWDERIAFPLTHQR